MSASPPLLLHVFSSFEVGGAQIRFATLANHFGSAFRHAIVAMDGQTACRDRLSPDLRVEYPAVTIRKGDTLGNVRRFRAMLRNLRPELLVTSGWGTIEWAMANLLPLARHLHMEDGFGIEERARQMPRRALLRRVLLRRSAVMLPSRTLCRIAAESWKLPPSCMRYIPNGVDLARFARARPVSGRDEPVIGTMAGLRPEKNVARLIRAFGLVRAELPARLVIVGEGVERARLEALVGQLGLAAHVRFVGQSDAPERFYPEFDVFALSSDTEQMPLSVLEAMASGLAVVTTDVGDIGEMVATENRPFLTALDDRALAQALIGTLRDPGLRARLGGANRQKVERDFNQTAMIEAYRTLFTGARRALPGAKAATRSVATMAAPGAAAEARR